jgi:ribose 5-phosphate isomerase B
MNVLCIGGRVIGPELAREIITTFVNSSFIGNDKGEERHKRRVEKVRKLEENISNFSFPDKS